MEKYFEDARQDEKHVPDLLESIIQPPGLVKEELRPISFKIDKFGHQITKIRVWSKSQKFRNGFVDGPEPIFEAAKPFRAIFGPARGQIFQKCGF